MVTTGKFNEGKLTSNTIDRQFTDEFVTTAVVTMPKRKKVFGSRSNRIVMPKHHGLTVSREIDYGMLDNRNLVDGNVDATTATLLQDVFYVLDSAGNVDRIFDAKEYLHIQGPVTGETVEARTASANAIQVAARADAKAAADTYLADTTIGLSGNGKVMSGSGGLVNGMTSYAATSKALTELPEEGGIINQFTHSSKMVSADLNFTGIGTTFTIRSIDLDSRKGLIARKIKHMGDTIADLKEMQIRRDLLTASHINRTLSVDPSNSGTISVSELDGLDKLNYDALEAFEQELLRNDIEMEAEILTGIDLVDTKTVDEGWILYVNNEVLPTLRATTGPGGTLVWTPVRQYKADKVTVDDEQGAIGAFRFVTVKDLEVEHGAGCEVDSVNDGAAGTTASARARKTRQIDGAGVATYHYDVFTAMLVGDDCFSVAGFGSNNTKASYIPPVKDNYHDQHGQIAGISASWSYGMLIYRPERIRSLSFTA